jgi:hypothetical protein
MPASPATSRAPLDQRVLLYLPDLDLISHLKAIPVGEAFCEGVARMRRCWGFCRPSPWRNRYWAMASRTQALLPSNGVIGDPNAPAHQPGCS